MNNDKLILGSVEWLSLHSLGIPLIKARIDSGAKTSSIHAFNIRTFTRRHETWVSFEIHPIQNNRKTVVRCEAKVFDKRIIKSTSGMKDLRYVVKTPLTFGQATWDIELTLANRDTMGYRMLLGRSAMEDRMLINPSGRFCFGDRSSREIEKAYDKVVSEPKKGLKIGLLASDPKLYSNQRIMEAGEERGHQMFFYNIRQCYMKLDANTPEIHHRGGSILNSLDAVIPRIRPSLTFYGCALIRQFESIGIYSLNSSSSISQASDKLFSLQLLLKNGLDIPITGFANSPLDTNDLISMVGGSPLVIKLLEGTQGRGVVLAETKKASQSVINAFKSLKANLLVQEFIREADGKDLRLFVVDGTVVASMQRQAAPGEFKANVHLGGTTSMVKITKEERKIAVKASRILGLRVAGVDIIRSATKGPLLLEVNSSPGLEGIENITGKDIAGRMIASVEKKLNWKLPLHNTKS